MSEMDDEVEITDVDDNGAPLQVDRAHLRNQDLRNQDLGSLTMAAGELLSLYGWHLLVVSILLYLLVQHLRRRFSQSSERSPTTHTQPDASSVVRNQEAMEAARIRMQAELDAKAAIFREKQKQQEEEKRRQKIEVWESMQQGKSYKGGKNASQSSEEASSSSRVLKPKSDKKTLRSSDFNPLSGEGGGSCSWRPGRRGPSSGG